MQHLSYVEQRGKVNFPEFTAERVYMKEFYKEKGLPSELSRWQNTVDSMLEGVETDEPIYLMIDQGVVKGGTSHRRGGLHVDGYWNPGVKAHGGRHGYQPPQHHGTKHFGSWKTGGWVNCDFKDKEALILASSLTAARGYQGIWEGSCGEGGDCSHINTSNLKEVVMHAGNIYAGNVTMLHESLPVAEDCIRTLVRLNVPGWSPEKY